MKNDLNIDAKFAFSFKLYSDISLLMPCIFCVPTSKLSKDGCRQREKVYRLDGCPPTGKSLHIGSVSEKWGLPGRRGLLEARLRQEAILWGLDI